MDDDYMRVNRDHWDEILAIHMQAWSYDVPGFKAGVSKLKPIERAELGDVRGKSLLHMQCHFGLDTLSWAREGANVTGIDYSEPAIAQARALAEECGIEARFLVSNVYDLPDNLGGEFDIVYTGYGALSWLPDIERWAQIAASYVRPGGTFYVVEFHPIVGIFDDEEHVTDLTVRWPYFPGDQPLRWEGYGDYTDRSAKLAHDVTYEWPHPTSEVLTALIDAGLRIEFFHEFAETPWSALPQLSEMDEDGTWRLRDHHGSVPMIYSIRATKDG